MFDILACSTYISADKGAIDTISAVTRLVVTIIQVAVPILLVIWGMLDLGKAVTAQKDDEIKKGQQTLIKRAITAAIVFFVIAFVKLIIGMLLNKDANKNNIMDCIDCFISSDKKC